MNNKIKEMNFSEMLFNRDERLLDYITNLQKENDDLKNRLENAVADCNLRLHENKQLNNIINELEEDIEKKIYDIKNNYSQVNGNYFNMNYVIDTYEDVLDKLKELKENK